MRTCAGPRDCAGGPAGGARPAGRAVVLRLPGSRHGGAPQPPVLDLVPRYMEQEVLSLKCGMISNIDDVMTTLGWEYDEDYVDEFGNEFTHFVIDNQPTNRPIRFFGNLGIIMKDLQRPFSEYLEFSEFSEFSVDFLAPPKNGSEFLLPYSENGRWSMGIYADSAQVDSRI